MLGRYYPGQTCSAASALELIGERWSLLIFRDALFRGYTRFSDFERSLGIAPNILTKRLESFVADGLMTLDTPSGEAREYHLTAKGRGLKSVIIALNDWGERWLGSGPIDYIHRGCGGVIKQTVACEGCGTEVALDDIGVRVRTA
ncbi:helix-turn-helix domain-containing protein [Phenylobacterium sp.]|uniref:winged helix-turn-helix transcriptional regulator n=1 Tax=Phenylobacterium sp. TaxID=1871053 RepID=UPI00120081A1|nr:helix-turn-helix domain-containing protein [Phenylobacterium sp.]THD58881.1 MAG: transcriptional regulator [Phenylobacterium sp.]